MSVHYKFKSSLDYDSVTFEGGFISVGDLKKAIVEQKKLGHGTDFDLRFKDAQTSEEYVAETQLVPKNTALIVQRVPATRSQPILAPPPVAVTSTVSTTDALYGSTPTALGDANAPINEQQRIQNLLADAASTYKPAAGERPMRRRARAQHSAPANGAPPPPQYKCHRCGQSGHYIQQCPTNDDPSFDHRKLKHAVGIPLSALRVVDAPEYDADHNVPDGTTLPTFVTPDGQLAVFRPSEDEFAKAFGGTPLVDEVEIPSHLTCKICKQLLVEAVNLPCCSAAFCDDCIRNVLLDVQRCPACGTEDLTPDQITPSSSLRAAVNAHLAGGVDTHGSSASRSDRPPPPHRRPSRPPRDSRFDPSQTECFHCHQSGHVARDCPNRYVDFANHTTTSTSSRSSKRLSPERHHHDRRRSPTRRSSHQRDHRRPVSGNSSSSNGGSRAVAPTREPDRRAAVDGRRRRDDEQRRRDDERRRRHERDAHHRSDSRRHRPADEQRRADHRSARTEHSRSSRDSDPHRRSEQQRRHDDRRRPSHHSSTASLRDHRSKPY